MATLYICKGGRRASKSTHADNTGNRDTENCKGCPYLLPCGPTEWTGKGFEQNVQGHECRMSPEISYATDYSGSANDKCTLKIHSLDLDFLEDIQAWIDEYADGQLSGRFSRDTIRGIDYCNKGRYSWSISCAQNKKGMAAKGALIERFFGLDGHRLDMTPEEEKAHILAAIEAGKAKAQERKENMDYIISKHEATGRLYAYYKGAFWFWDSHIQRWLLSQFAEDLYQEERPKRRNFEREHFLAQTSDFHQLDDYEVPSRCIEALLQCNPKTAKTAEKENPTSSAAATAAAEETVAAPEPSDSASMTAAPVAKSSEPAGVAPENILAGADGSTAFDYSGLDDQTVADDVCPYLELIENSKKYSCQCSICGDRFVNTEICNKTFLSCGWYLDQQDKDALNHSEENTDKDNCLCRTCGSEECPGRGCNKECPNGSDGSCFTATCPGYIERTDIICKDKATNAPSVDAAATSDESAARMCEGPDEETQITPAAASGAALESLHAQSALPQNAPAQDIAADAPSALGFDYSGLDAVAVDTLHVAERIIRTARQKYIVDMAGAVSMVHGELVRNSDEHNNQHTEDTFIAWCRFMGISKTTAYQLLQVQSLISGATAEEQATLEAASPSLLYAAAKPSAPAELVQAVKDGEITTHKQYQEALAEIRARDAKIENLLEMSEAADRRAEEAERMRQDVQQKCEEAIAHIEVARNMQIDTARERDEARRREAKADARAREAEEENSNLRRRLQEIEERPRDVAVMQPSEDQIEAWRREGAERLADTVKDQVSWANKDKLDAQRQVVDLQKQLEESRPDADACQRTVDILYETTENLRLLLRSQLKQAQLSPNAYGKVVAHVLQAARNLMDTVRVCSPDGYDMDSEEDDDFE